MENKNTVWVLVPSDMSGKPIQSALAKTFSGRIVKTVNLCDEVITDYSSIEAERAFQSLIKKLCDFLHNRNLEDNVYLLCGGAVVNACLTLHILVGEIGINFLVWEKKTKRYEIFDTEGRRVEDEDNRELEYRQDEGTFS